MYRKKYNNRSSHSQLKTLSIVNENQPSSSVDNQSNHAEVRQSQEGLKDNQTSFSFEIISVY
jgi:hypothetical protein